MDRHTDAKRYNILSVTSHIKCIAARCQINVVYLYQVMVTLYFFNDVAIDAESTQKNKNYVIIASLTSETMDKRMNRIPGSRLLSSSLTGSALRTHVESLGKPRDVNKHSQSLACAVKPVYALQ